jgi:hypothetical protein
LPTEIAKGFSGHISFPWLPRKELFEIPELAKDPGGPLSYSRDDSVRSNPARDIDHDPEIGMHSNLKTVVFASHYKQAEFLTPEANRFGLGRIH